MHVWLPHETGSLTALKNVDFPTEGFPTQPITKLWPAMNTGPVAAFLRFFSFLSGGPSSGRPCCATHCRQTDKDGAE